MPTESWRRSLADGIGQLGRWFEGRYGFEADEPTETVPADLYFDPDFMRRAIAASHTVRPELLFQGPPASDTPESEVDLDLRVAVSRVTRHYTACLSVAAYTALAHGVALDMSPRNCRFRTRLGLPFTLVLDYLGEGAVVTPERPTPWRVTARQVPTLAEARAHAWRTLYGTHLAPLFETVRRITRVSRRLLWTNAAEWLGMISDSADEYLAGAGRPYVKDRQALMNAPSLPEVPGENPLRGLVVWDPVPDPRYPHGIHRRLACCLTYRLEDRLGRLCQNCPLLSLDERLALVRERFGVRMGIGGGPAERQSIRRGLERIARSERPGQTAHDGAGH